MIDSKLLEAYVNELKTRPEMCQQYLPSFHDLLQMHLSILHLLQSCVLQDISVQATLLQDKQALRRLVLLLGISFKGKLRKPAFIVEETSSIAFTPVFFGRRLSTSVMHE